MLESRSSSFSFLPIKYCKPKFTPEARILKLQQLQRLADEVRRASRAMKGKS
jgi:hypothetical protein